MSVVVLANLAALKTTSTADLKGHWRKFNDTELPACARFQSIGPSSERHCRKQVNGCSR